MKRVKVQIGIMVVATLLLTSCAEKKKSDSAPEVIEVEHHSDSKKNHIDEKHQNTPGVSFNDQTVEKVYQHYIHIKTALVNTDAAESQKGGKMLAEALSEIDGNNTLKDAVSALANTEDVEKQREAFSTISDAITVLVKGKVASGEVYQQYCPMAFDFKGAYWLSSEKEIRNPYFGDKMLKCGEVKATIN